MRLFGKRTAREKEIRRSLSELMEPWYHRWIEPIRPQPLIILLLSATAAALLVNMGEDNLGLKLGQSLSRGIGARVPIRVEDRKRTDVMRMRAADNAADFFVLDVSLVQDVRGRLASALRIAREQAADPQKLIETAAAIKVLLDDDGVRELGRLAETSPELYERAVERAIETLRRTPLIEPEDPLLPRGTALTSIMIDPEQGAQREVSIHRLLFANAPDDVARVADTVAESFPAGLRGSIRGSILAMLEGDSPRTYKPLYRYDAARSTQAAEEAAAAVPVQVVEYPVDARLADAGVINEDELALLREEHEAFRARQAIDKQAAAAARLQTIARGVIAFLLVLGVGAYILLRREARAGPAPSLAAVALTLLIVLAACRVTYLYAAYPYAAVGLYAFAVFLLALVSGRTSAQAAAAMLAILATMALRQGMWMLVVMGAIMLVAFALLRDTRRRGQIIAVGVVTALVTLVTTLLAAVIDGQTLEFAFWNRALWAAVTTLAAAFLVEGLLPGIERLFGVTTNMTLLEWCDPNKPLLRMMAAEAPGTYNHSLLVGTLAGACAEAIGANGLLARAGAYYHDIGKINKPEYFVENQSAEVGNRHERLTPAMSHLVITGHVKDGIAMAREYGVPAALHAFIPEHHGTCVVEYFFHAATKARRPGDPEISDSQFRYPGPKPQSRETAIVMMCDSVEGAVRAMPDPTPGRIEDTVSRIIEKRLADGQFDECDLTFRELAAVRQALVKSLVSLYHARIRYPDEESKDEPREDESEPRTA